MIDKYRTYLYDLFKHFKENEFQSNITSYTTSSLRKLFNVIDKYRNFNFLKHSQ